MGQIMRGAVMSGVGQGAAAAGSQILNAFMMKQRLDVQKKVAESQSAKNQSDMKRNDAYTQYLTNQDVLKQIMDAHGDVPARIQARLKGPGAGAGPGSTAMQLATRYSPGANPPAIVDQQSPDNPGAGLPRGMAVPQNNPAPDRSAMRPPAVQSPAMTPPPPPPGDPRNLVAPQFDMPMFGDHDAT